MSFLVLLLQLLIRVRQNKHGCSLRRWCHIFLLLQLLSFRSDALTVINSTTNNYSPNKQRNNIIPITVLSGFLGSGKTTLLQHMLKCGKRIAVIVNDVASVNIDSKLVKGTLSSLSTASMMVELQNGCACCSLSEELLSSVSELVLLSDMRADPFQFDHIVIELSGVADPKSVRAKFQEALLYDMPLMQRVRLDTMVTVIDCSVFLQRLRSEKTATPLETPELFYRNGQTPPRPAATTTSETDPAWENMPPALLEALGMAPNYDNNNNGVAELLVGQTETADVLLLNKVDLLDNDDSDETLEQIQQICRALNPRATILQCQFGQVPMHQILAVAGGTGVVEAGVVDDHRDAVEAAAAAAGVVAADEAAVVDRETKGDDDENNMLDAHAHHDHSLSSHHDHENHNHNVEDGTNPDCKDQSHAHTHQHHAEDHTSSNNCNDPTCTDSSHAHSHDHFTATSFACTDPDCNDPTHEHSHQHHHHDPNHAGIGSFVYRARRPFHPGRLLTFLRRLPVVRGLPKGEPNEEEHSIQVSPMAEMAIRELLRSKGFTWCADSNIAALYWSHAGTSFEMQCLGRWWATLPREQWPSDAVPVILADFDDEQHVEDNQMTTTTTSVGDRRQEIVFIGLELGRREWQLEICKSLDQCLLNDEEWSTYQQLKGDENALRLRFANSVKSQMLTY